MELDAAFTARLDKDEQGKALIRFKNLSSREEVVFSSVHELFEQAFLKKFWLEISKHKRTP